jgi:SAM-dependent methyltransferase
VQKTAAGSGSLGNPGEMPVTPGDEFTYIIPDARLVDRTSALRAATRGKRAIHIGFVDEGRLHERLERGQWLHAQLAEVAQSLVGLDLDDSGVRAARELGYEAYAVDCQDTSAIAGLQLPAADVIIAGELIEHLDKPGLFLEAIKPLLVPGGTLEITTPNAARITNVLGSLANREFVNDDHVCWFSWHTLSVLLKRHGWQITDLAYYVPPSRPRDRRWSLRARAEVHAANLVRQATTVIARARPAIADGLVVTARLDEGRPLNGK